VLHESDDRFQRIVVLAINDLWWLPFQQHTFLLPLSGFTLPVALPVGFSDMGAQAPMGRGRTVP
ncbi:hypothetical protein, partial [Klebsiella michiganensis]|uniref:hypothetical protein n=1 Tax=Klebsiella michiganensis TaxID=1134687 RepID=UPI001CCD2B7F